MVQMEIGWKPRADDRLICLAVEALAVHIGKPVVGFSALLMSAIMFAQNENVAPQDLKIVTTEQDISSERSSLPVSRQRFMSTDHESATNPGAIIPR